MTTIQFVAIFSLLIAIYLRMWKSDFVSVLNFVIAVLAYMTYAIAAHGQEIILGPSVGRPIGQPGAIARSSDSLYACDNNYPSGSNILWRYNFNTNTYVAVNQQLKLCLGVAVLNDVPYVTDYGRNAIVNGLTNAVMIQGSGTMTQPSGLTVYQGVLMWGSYTNWIYRQQFFADHPELFTTFAGTGKWGYNGDGLPALQTTFSTPGGVSAAPSGAVYVAEYAARVRLILNDVGHTVTTFAGTGVYGSTGDGGPAAQAALQPAAVDVAGSTVYISDRTWCKLRMVDGLMPSSTISTVAQGCSPTWLTHDDLYEYVSWTDGNVRRYRLPHAVPPTATVKPSTTATAQPTGTPSRSPTLTPSVTPTQTTVGPSVTPESIVLPCLHGVECRCLP